MNGNLRGDLLVACSAVFYSLHVVRLGERTNEKPLVSLLFRREWPVFSSTDVSVAPVCASPSFQGKRGSRLLYI